MLQIFAEKIQVMGGGGGVEVIKSKGCSRLSGLHCLPLKFRKRLSQCLRRPPLLGQSRWSDQTHRFPGLANPKKRSNGGLYSPRLHPQCTHLVVQSFGGRKFEHALKHGSRNGLSIVTIGWFVDSVGKNVRLSESLYSISSFGQNGIRLDELNRLVGFSGTENSCLPVGAHGTTHLSTIEEPQCSTLSGHSCISTWIYQLN